MYKYIILTLLALVIVSCNKNSSSPTSNDNNNNNNNNNSQYFVDWNVGSQHYRVTGNISDVGACINTLFSLSAKVSQDSAFPRLMITIDTVSSKGTFTWSKDNSNKEAIVWYGTSSPWDMYTFIEDNSETSGTINITDYSNSSVSGNFTAKLGKHTLPAGAIEYKSVSGSFTIPKVY